MGQEQVDIASGRLRADRQPSAPPSSANVFNRQETSETSIQGVDVHIPGRIQKQSYLENGGTGWSLTCGGCNLNLSKDHGAQGSYGNREESVGTITDILDSFIAQSAQQHAVQEQAAFAAATDYQYRRRAKRARE